MCGSNNPPPPPGKPVTITLSVNASALYNADPQPSTQAELDAYCGLSDNNLGQIPPGKATINEFLSQVYSSNTVTWVGVAVGDSSGYQVKIESISNNPSFFASDPPGGNSGRVTATLKPNIGGVEDTYSIYFIIDPPGNGDPKGYNLDPKLKGNN